MTENPKRIRFERIGVTFKDGAYNEGPWRDASNDLCYLCGKLLTEHSTDLLQTCLKQGDLEYIRRTRKPIIETVNGVTRQVYADHPSPFWGKNKPE